MPQPSVRLFAERADVLEYKEVPRLFLAVRHHLICALKYLFSLTKHEKEMIMTSTVLSFGKD